MQHPRSCWQQSETGLCHWRKASRGCAFTGEGQSNPPSLQRLSHSRTRRTQHSDEDIIPTAPSVLVPRLAGSIQLPPDSCLIPSCWVSSHSSGRRVCKPESHCPEFVRTKDPHSQLQGCPPCLPGIHRRECQSRTGWGIITVKARCTESCCRTEVKSLQESRLSALHKICVSMSSRQQDQSTCGSPYRPEQLREGLPSASADISLGFWK